MYWRLIVYEIKIIFNLIDELNLLIILIRIINILFKQLMFKFIEIKSDIRAIGIFMHKLFNFWYILDCYFLSILIL